MGFDADPSPPSSPSSFKYRLRSSICLSCCFRGAAVDAAVPGERVPVPAAASLIGSSAAWIRARAPEIGGRCGRGAANMLGRHHGRRHHAGAGDFRYDPLSYALNFDEGPDDGYDLSAAAAGAGGPPFRTSLFLSHPFLHPFASAAGAAASSTAPPLIRYVGGPGRTERIVITTVSHARSLPVFFRRMASLCGLSAVMARYDLPDRARTSTSLVSNCSQEDSRTRCRRTIGSLAAWRLNAKLWVFLLLPPPSIAAGATDAESPSACCCCFRRPPHREEAGDRR